jgi:MFS family permease
MYDFMVFGYYAGAIAATFFPSHNAYASLMLSLGTFGAGFLMRPLGAVVLGAYVDRYGRRAGLLLTLTLMAVGTLSIAVVPGFATLGLLAPAIVLAGRLVQGLSAGVELGGVSVYLSEIATPGRKGFFVSWQSASQQVAVVFAAMLGILLTRRFTPDEMSAWGWRVPLLIGCALLPFVFVMRRSLSETAVFLERSERPTLREIMASLAHHRSVVALGTMLVMMTTVSFYFITVYTPTFGSTVLHLAPIDNFIVTCSVGVSNFVLLPTMGGVSDRIGRHPLLIAATTLMLVTAYPALAWLVSQPSFGRLLTVELWFSLLFASYNGAMVAYLTEIMPPLVRTTSFSLAYSLATALFGGFTPAVATYLIHATANRAMPGVWLAGAAASSLIATSLLIRSNVLGERDMLG